MKLSNLLTVGFTLLLIVIVSSCEEDFSTLETDIINENFATDVDSSSTIVTYSQLLNGVQTNRLPLYQMGVYNDPFFGTSRINMLAQVNMDPQGTNPTFGDCVVLDSVYLYIPFFSNATTTDDESTYTLDSIFGDKPINISVFASNYFLRDNDPATNFEEVQRYFSNQSNEFEKNLGQLLATVEGFTPSKEAIEVNDSTFIAPGFRVKLPNAFFEDKILSKEGDIVLLNNNNFREHFRGLYFAISNPVDGGHLAFYDLENQGNPANITLYYRNKDLEDDDTCETTTTEFENQEYSLFLGAIKVNTINNDYPPSLLAELNNQNTMRGEANTYLRGGDGIMTFIDLFGKEDFKKVGEANGAKFLVDGPNGVPDELDLLRTKQWLINEANLIFYVDQDKVQGGSTEPERIIIFDTKNNTVLADFATDLTGGVEPVNAVTEHLGRLERDASGNGKSYKIKITNHISNLINKDSTNVTLGLMVSQNVTVQTSQTLKTPFLDDNLERVPSSAIISPEGTVLHGNLSSDVSKRVQLKIYYTDPN